MIEINSKKTTGYIIHKVTDSDVLVCKILKECTSEEEATKDLIRLLSNNVTENQLLKENRGRTREWNNKASLTPYVTPHIIILGAIQMSKWEKLIKVRRVTSEKLRLLYGAKL